VIEQRLKRCREHMRRSGVRGYLITNRMDQIYLTGFDGEDGAVVVTPKGVHVITDGRFEQSVKMQAPWAPATLRTGGLEEAIGQVCGTLRCKELAFQADHVAVETLGQLRRACRPARLVAAPPIVNRLRLSKDRNELGKIGRAIDIAESAFRAMRRKLRVGMTESEIAALLEYEMKRRGAIEPSFRTIVAEGRNAALPHAEPGRRKIKKGSLLLIDWGAVSDYYCSDLTRMLFVGTIAPRLKQLYQIVLQAQQKGIAAIAPGRRACDIDQVARDHITQAGYGEKFGHGLGHGLGLDIHESPRLKYGFDDVLEPGMVVTVEPGIYLPGIGGIRIEDDVLVTSSGYEVLTRLPKSLASAVI